MKAQKHKIGLFLIIGALFFCFCSGCSAPTVFKGGDDAKQGFSFIYMGDSQADPETGDYSTWGQMLEQAAADKSKPVFVMIGGDLVNDGSSQEEWDNFFAAGGAVLKKLHLYPAMGNHDNTALFKKIFELPANGPAGKEEAFYSFDYGDAHFTVMDSNVMGAANKEDMEWLEKDLAQTDKTYKIVMFHHPAYPAVEIPKDSLRADVIQKNFVPIMEKAGVNLVLTGHQHVYMRTWPLKNGQRSEDGIVYLMGYSGGKRYTPGVYDYVACSIGEKPVYSIITVDQKGITIKTMDSSGQVLDTTGAPDVSAEQHELTITIKGDGIEGEKKFTLGELAARPDTGFQHIYSTINNWPTARFYAARGITVRSILKAAGVLDTARVITFSSDDSYKISFTREQLLDSPQYYYPRVKEGSAELAEPVEPIIAYEYKEGSADMAAAVPDVPCLIIGQRNPLEHTNPAFVVNVAEIIVSSQDPGKWEAASTFPAEGKIASGETVKLQHKYAGLIKLHYTLDGTDPTELSTIYNPSTYQPELNVPIPIKEDTVIKVLVSGYGKHNSEIKSFTFKAQ
ncbi:MAG: hypothetical protein GXY49_07265 [Syntrophomonadaceae bacterium]|nr:hypothetical protein [Syntrophomonadaceae bacterium]